MSFIAPFIELLGVALRIWEHKEKNKYHDRYERLVREIRSEESKDASKIDDARLDDLYFELRILGDSFTKAANENAANK